MDDGEHQRTSCAILRSVAAKISLSATTFGIHDEDDNDISIPTVLQSQDDTFQTPLPILPMVVLAIAMLGEFLCANVSGPFMLFMVHSFGGFKDDAEVAFWTGLLVSMFFLTQFLTSMAWATIADRYGRRMVLVVSLSGSALCCVAFGLCSTLPQAIVVRLLQGVFGGAIGVAKGSVSFITDMSNEGRAYAILGFCWGLGGVAGAILGGAFEMPGSKWPSVFGHLPLFIEFPYLLPCMMAAVVTFSGGLLACFLSPDGGPRQYAEEPAQEKNSVDAPIRPRLTSLDADAPSSPLFIGHRLSRQLSGALHRVSSVIGESSTRPRGVRLELERTWTGSSSGRVGVGYGTFRTTRSNASSIIRRRLLLPPGDQDENPVNLAERLFSRHAGSFGDLSDLWVAAAMSIEVEGAFGGEEDINGMGYDSGADTVETDDGAFMTHSYRDREWDSDGCGRHSRSTSRRPLSQSMPLCPSRHVGIPLTRTISIPESYSGSPVRRTSSGIFSNTGVREPTATMKTDLFLTRTDSWDPAQAVDRLPPIIEGQRASPAQSIAAPLLDEVEPSPYSQLPMAVILQYALLALHTTTHDQVFMSYLVSEYNAGGLNLNAGRFAQLIALMCVCQIMFQFLLYPTIGPPRGPLSHLAMLRLGSLLFIPAYLTVTLYRSPFASEGGDGNLVLMAALAVSTAIRFCGSTFAYTAVAILLNYMTPPRSVGVANGVAQSMVSLARCIGPMLGGWLWSLSVSENVEGFSFGFMACSAMCSVAIVLSFWIR
ncbi:hypothetical protein CYLTODRAFT_392381 [Cylindrobasidium torrendii FP15055 ss-10]|uniref:Major facilitator superfamily MFS-1 n=1 Tax=Cylindrobasidium torrendii FP15055 ss-10 TaxID=1314674 RepID=A0A0D7BIF9_9AGAR|nr:hypothetical protein CYLTODRAFT_392381 [Cylindrobasidium torrendii FP15055 ss-10]